MKDLESAKPADAFLASESAGTLLKDPFLRTDLPEIKNTCPLCAQEIKTGMTRCPRCKVPVNSEEAAIRLPANVPAPASSAGRTPLEEVASEKHVIVSPSSDRIIPSPALTEPPKRTESPPRMVTAAPAEAKLSRRGLVNGRGATNGLGLVNGRGAINGMGLVNGTGMVNGTRPDERVVIAYREKSSFLTKWQFLAVLIAIVVVLPMFIYLSYARQSELAVDGDFGEWTKVAKFGMQAPAALPEVSVDEWAIQSDANMLHVYIKTGSNIMGTSYVDSFFLFVDSDGNPATGYSVSGIGANYMLELHGWDQKVESASLMRFDSESDRLNWTSWTSIDSLEVATKAERLEAMANLPAALTSDARLILLAQDNMPNRVYSVSYPVLAEGGVLIVEQKPGTGVNPFTGAIPLASNISLAKLILRCEGISGTVYSISPVIVAGGLASPVSSVSLSPGESKTVEVFVASSSTPSHSLISAYVTKAGVSSTFADVVIIGDPVRAYVFSPPELIQIDGAFGDWMGHVSPDNDSESLVNPNTDMASVGSVNTTSYAAFYVGVKGEIFQGAYVPAVRGKPTSQGGGGGGGPVVPHRKSGEDMLRIYIDSDVLSSTGQMIQRSSKVIGADYLLKIDGINGEIVSQSLMAYGSDGWTTVSVDVAAAADSQRIETSVPSMYLGGTSSFVAIIETTDWRDRGDWAWTGSVPDPWVIDAYGNTYMSNDGSTWSYLGTPTLEPGDYIVDIALTTTDSDVFLVTNTGRTYYWTLGSGTSWTTGQTNSIETANWPQGVAYSEAVSITFYSGTGAYLLTKNGSFFYVMKAGSSQKPWDWYGYANQSESVTDFVDFMYVKAATSAYALRSGPNTRLSFSASGNAFTSWTSPTGSTSNQTDLYFIGSSSNTTDRVFVLCENGNIRYSPNGGQTWSALGDLPVPTGGNTSKYVGLGIDPAGYMWVVTDTGYTYRSTDTTIYANFTYMGQSPISAIVAILPTTVIPEFPILAVPILALVAFVVAPRIMRRRSD